MRYLGLDIGDRRIGVAISDPEQILASPLSTIVRDDDDKTVTAIIALVDKYQVLSIIIGLPYSLDGSIGNQATKVQAFVDLLSKRAEVNIELIDERFSTVAVERLLLEAGLKSQKRKEHRDAAAAAFILQGYLDSLKACDQ
ncbi:Holliday junction resolvase RuvX [Chloroflexota bacterium]